MKCYNRDEVMAYMETVYTKYVDTEINELNCNELAEDVMCKFTGISHEDYGTKETFDACWEFFSMAQNFSRSLQ